MEQVHSVAVIGAGVSGLYAAHCLRNQFPDLVVLEAQAHVGGRIKQVHGLAPWPVELGPEFVHGSDSVLAEFIKEQGFSTRERDWPDWWYFSDQKKLMPNTEVDEEVGKVHKLFDDLDLEASPAPREPDVSMEEWLKARGATPRMLSIAEACYANDFSCSLRQLGLRESIEENRRWDSGETYLLMDRSMGAVATKLAQGLDIRTQWPVSRVQYDGQLVTLTSGSGATLQAKKVIITVALSVLQREVIQFQPRLPAPKLAAIKRLRMGNVIKVICAFSKRFWPDGMYDVLCTDCFAPEFWMTNYPVTDESRKGVHVITGFVAGERADVAGKLSEAECTARFIAQLDTIFGSASEPKPASSCLVATHVVDWAKQAHVWGAYSYPSMGAELGDRDLLAAPVAGQIFFAGEAAHSAVNPCIQAAMETGIRAAAQVQRSLTEQPGCKL